ncbi:MULTISPECIES: OsmC family protein [Ramlibacter]|uniref:OsmC family peroxiredoxin n=1 Tax=Ramlibacter pinisoli TaxID=2682844 RepID=A0A6N8ITI4_9BURK|nr:MULTISPECIES: OsmC family protein [Ramlibacter]MBA2965182.1 OsmC family protein [Ramlibacter sp. CGMCC 1.13660]MVQ30147.1 OsmC family peroxiredoxin [Ramlibacter pinisoli]
MTDPVLAHSLQGSTAVELGAGTARWRADLDPDVGGAGDDPTPHQLLDSALAACTVLTMQLYARRKQYPLATAEVRIERDEGPEVYRMRRLVTVEGALDDRQRADLLRVANACPIHKALGKRFEIETTLA